MRNVYDLVDLAPIIAAARALAFADDTLERVLPARPVDEVDYRLGQARRLDQTVKARPLDTPAPIIARPGVLERRGGLPAFAAMDLLTESDLTKARRLAGLPIDLRADVAAAAGRAVATILNTMETLRGQVIATGQIAIQFVGDSAPQSVDFGLATSNKVIAPASFTLDTTDALSQLQAYSDAYIASSGGPAGQMLTSTRVLRLLLRNKSIIAAVTGTAAGRTSVNRVELNGLLAAEGLPSVSTYDKVLENASGAKTRIFPDDRIALLPGDGATVGTTDYGPTAESIELVGAGVLRAEQAPGVAVVTLVNDHPVQKAVNAAAIGMPVLRSPQDLLVAKVA